MHDDELARSPRSQRRGAPVELVVGYHRDFPPFCAETPSGPQGSVVPRLAALLRHAGAAPRWRALDLDEQIPELLGGQVDVVAALGVTDERRRIVEFGPVLAVTGGALFRLVGPVGERAPATIVTPAAGPLRTAAGTAFPQAAVREVPDYDAALGEVLAGRADAAALNLDVGWRIAERLAPGRFAPPDRPFLPVELAPAFEPRRHRALARRLRALSGPTPT
ncbi:MAG: transporter substrate-binding domain-containing protein [Acidimicrobiia bacterium]|nr:transporter substrate-binding domain-containing protein [Acidimicrobiia bacterium]